MHRRRLRTIANAILATALAATMAFCLGSCKNTDFFTEVVISPFSETVDEDNDLRTIVNSPDSEEESATLSALDWTDDSTRSEETENLVVYSSDPTSILSTRHSIFDLFPMLTGVESSDGVRVLYDADADLDEENEGDEDEQDDAEEESTGGETAKEALESLLEELAGTGTTSGEATEGSGTTSGGDSDSGDSSGSQSGGDEASDGSGSDEGSGDDGTSDDENGGYDGEVDVYDPGNAFAEVPQVDSVAVIGTDAAVLVESIGGNGSICAMTVDAYYGTGDDNTAASSFQVVFGELAGEIDTDEFESEKILWDNDGTDPEDLVSVEALIEACGENGVIVYEQTLGDQYDFFDDEQREALYDAGITLVPVDLSTVQGILDAVAVIGDALDGSATCENDSQEYASLYTSTVRSIVKGVAATHGGTLASTSKSGSYTLLTEYNNCPVGSASVVGGLGFPIVAYIATDAATGWSWNGSYDIDVSSIVLFQNNDYDSSPLAFWGQVAGVAPGSDVNNNVKTLTAELLWPYTKVVPTSSLSGSGSEYNRWLSSDSAYDTMQAGPTSVSEGLAIPETYGLGSKYIPYLIVSATDDLTADEVRSLTVDSLGSYGTSGEITTYSAFPFYSASSGEGTNSVPTSSNGLRSTIGALNAESDTYESPFYTALSTSSVVRANPTGLLGSWTEGNMESVLEAIWLAELYSYSPDGCDYEAINDMSDFSVTIGGIECTTTEEAVTTFYEVFYRVSEDSAEACYDAAVTDQLEDLK